MTFAHALVSFALLAGLLTVVPGIDTALVLRSTVLRGRAAGFATALGVNCGVLAWGVAAAVGVSALLSASELAFTALRLAGAGYLLWLGVTMVRNSFRAPYAPALTREPDGDRAATPLLLDWRRGFLTNLLNPKVGVFYMATIPQFLPHDVPPAAMGVALALVHNLEGMAWFAALIVVTSLARSWFSRGTVRRWTDRVTGGILGAFGIGVAVEATR